MQARVDFVDRHYQQKEYYGLLDIGIGSGAFIDLRLREWFTLGYDVSPSGIAWLKKRDVWHDPYEHPVQAATMWDVLEHIPDYPKLLDRVHEWLFLSLPIFRDAEHALRSKHFKPKEHCWYFSRDGLLFAMEVCGFALVSESYVETELGREDIGSFAFRRNV